MARGRALRGNGASVSSKLIFITEPRVFCDMSWLDAIQHLFCTLVRFAKICPDVTITATENRHDFCPSTLLGSLMSLSNSSERKMQQEK